jgi:hypothetical protein
MKTRLRLCALTAALPFVPVSFAGSSSSANYTITPATIDSGGDRLTATSPDYTIDATLGTIAGTSSAGTPAHVVKAGYAGQLYDEVALIVSTDPVTLDEGSTRQLHATALLDDSTLLFLDATAVNWSVASGPITSVSTDGLATAGVVYQNTPAQVQGVRQGHSDLVDLSVVDVSLDNFGTYAGDQIDDAWQVLNFGQNSANAGPTLDPDGDGQSNIFEFAAGTGPTNAQSNFHVRIERVTGQPNTMRIVYGPVAEGRTYTVVTSSDLTAGSWPELQPGQPAVGTGDNFQDDPAATGARKFYRVRITRL